MTQATPGTTVSIHYTGTLPTAPRSTVRKGAIR
jgi:FKBP-type peptidyl-prolyl cis-trans isomerase